MSSTPPPAPAESASDEDIEDDIGAAPASEKPPNWSVQMIKAERTIYELFRRWNDGKGSLDVQPDFQRGFVWNHAKQVALVESVLLRIPLPVIYLSEESEQQTLVIDGQQRLTTLFNYMKDRFPLSDLGLLPELNGRRFSGLEPRLQRRFEDTAMTAFIIQPGSDPRIKFEVFQRLNQGAVELNAQEIRNCLYRGPGLLMVKELAAPDALFRAAAGPKRQFKRMRAEELVLRCLAFIDQGPEQYKGDLLTFLNTELSRLNTMPEHQRIALRERFERAIQITTAIFGENAFRRENPWTGGISPALNAALMEVIVVGFASMLPTDVDACLTRIDRPKLINRRDELMHDDAFTEAITLSTGDRNSVKTRFQRWMKGLHDATKNHG